MIAEYISTQEWVTVRELAEIFEVRVATTRRDLDALVRAKRAVRMHGGASRAVVG